VSQAIIATIDEIDVAEFASCREQWNELLYDSGADALFLSWDWLHTWWTFFGQDDESSMHIVRARDESGKWLGVAPMYSQLTKYRFGLSGRLLQFIGSRWRSDIGLVTEYLDFLVRPGESAGEVRNALLGYIFDQLRWDELVFSYMKNSQPLNSAVSKLAQLRNHRVQVLGQAMSYEVSLDDGMSAYLSSLSSNMRRSIWNKRRQLLSHGAVSIDFYGTDRLADGLECIDALHIARFGHTVFSRKSKEFIIRLAELPDGSLFPRISLLTVEKSPVSATLDVFAANGLYNLHIGFNPDFDPKLSLGLLHLGYNIEDAFSSGYHKYDLLVGGGKNNVDYKWGISNSRTNISSVRVLRSTKLGLAYGLRLALRRLGI